MRILISAGEASSDMYGAQLITALRARVPDAEFLGVGGERMRAAGCDTVVDARHLAVVGITEIVGHLPKIYGEFRKLLRAVDALPQKPDVAVVIDSPAFNFRVARQMHARGIPVVYYVAPQLWAWREHRVQRIQRWVRKVLCIFPFEEEFYRKHGVDVEYVGHPQAHLPRPSALRGELARELQADPEHSWIGMLPGSRKKEIVSSLPGLLQTARLLRPKYPAHDFLFSRTPSIDKEWFLQEIKQAARFTHGNVKDLHITIRTRDALHHSRAAVVTSGTATVEAALMGTPFVCVYRVSPLTYHLARGMIKVPFVAMPNLIAGRRIVPELLQDDFTPANVARELEKILLDGPDRSAMLEGLREVQRKLGVGTGKPPAAERAADAVLRLLQQE
jgi:lipid-A-disaccharide synthase